MRPLGELLQIGVLACGAVFFGGYGWAQDQETGSSAEDRYVPPDGNEDGDPDRYVPASDENATGPLLGGGALFGQVRSTDPEATPGLGYFMYAEPGYQFSTGSWSRLEVSGRFLFGRLNFRFPEEDGGKVEMPVTFGLLARIGYGYSLGDDLFGIWRLGVGPMTAQYNAEPGGSELSSAEPLSGVAGELSYQLAMSVTELLDVTGGFSWTHMQFDLGDVEYESGRTVEANRPIIVNVPQIEVGLRARL